MKRCIQVKCYYSNQRKNITHPKCVHSILFNSNYRANENLMECSPK